LILSGREIAKPTTFEEAYKGLLAPTYVFLFGTVIPFAVIFFCNVGIIIGVRRAAGKRDNIATTTTTRGTRAAESKYMIRMLVLVSLAYVFCSMPLRVYNIITDLPVVEEIYDLKKPYWNLRYGVERWGCVTIWYSNYAVNFYMYFLGGGKKFRNDALEVIQKSCNVLTVRRSSSCCARRNGRSLL
jgi:hypothetical protein